jgi:mitochondrial import inner membrane translocase subunit TIM50
LIWKELSSALSTVFILANASILSVICLFVDVQYGWRHAKRPGLDKFINTLSQYYEIVIFSDNENITGPEVLEAVDKDHRCHRLFSNAGELRNNRILKRLDKMNRDIRRIILIDDNTVTSQLYPRNTILVKPYTDLADRSDTVLLDLIPVLQAFVHEDCKDFRETIDNLGSHQAEDLVQEYQMRVSYAKNQEMKRRNTGLGGVIRKSTGLAPAEEDSFSRSSILSAKQIVGAEPTEALPSSKSSAVPEVGFKPPKEPAAKKTGALFQWVMEKSKEKEELDMMKRQKLNELYMKSLEEKANKKEVVNNY